MSTVSFKDYPGKAVDITLHPAYNDDFNTV